MIVSLHANKKYPMKSFVDEMNKNNKGGKWVYNGFSIFMTK